MYNFKQVLEEILNKIPNDVINIISSYLSFTPLTKNELQDAVDLWCKNKEKALKIYGHISNLDTSNITDMRYLFKGLNKFNENINNWNVSNVVYMEGMFESCTNFNQPLNNLDVSNVTCMTGMFICCREFNQPLNKWNVSKVKNMKNMFEGCIYFNQPIHEWNWSLLNIS